MHKQENQRGFIFIQRRIKHRIIRPNPDYLIFNLCCVFSSGNVWIYSIYEPDYNKNTNSTDLYCDKTLYLFAFWTTTLVYIMVGVLMVIGCCFLLCFCLCGKADPDDNVQRLSGVAHLAELLAVQKSPFWYWFQETLSLHPILGLRPFQNMKCNIFF